MNVESTRLNDLGRVGRVRTTSKDLGLNAEEQQCFRNGQRKKHSHTEFEE